jgi:PleD family two-component response regulator
VGDDSGRLIARADAALYDAKRAGRDRVCAAA